MNRRERLMATLRGQSVDRPPVCFYEINGLDENADDSNQFNIYSDPSWKPLIDLAREKTDRIVMRSVPFRDTQSRVTKPQASWVPLEVLPDYMPGEQEEESWIDEKGSLLTKTTVMAPGRTLTSLTRRDPDVNTVWVLEPLLKSKEDLIALLELPTPEFRGEPDLSGVLQAEEELGDTGIVMIDIFDPLAVSFMLFEMGDFTVMALTEPKLFQRLLEFFFPVIQARVDAVSKALPGRLWRICGPEAAAPPFLSPRLFEQFVVSYDKPLVDSIHRHGGFARIHSHGRLKNVLDHIAATGCMGLDPIEPPPQGDVELSYVRQRYGQQMVLFGNLQIADIENLPTKTVRKKVATAIEQGTRGKGRGFVLMPSACPYGRKLTAATMQNYEAIVQMVE